jgi:hypothetical protein
MRENFGAKRFQQALIPNGLKIICKVLKGNLHPVLSGGGSPGGRTGQMSDTLKRPLSTSFGTRP